MGYQKDKKKRYPIDTKAHVTAAWSYINKGKNAGAYSSQQLARIKGKIKSAAKKFGIDLAAESAQLAAEISEVLEAYASACLDNNTATVDVRAYVSDPSQLAAVGAKLSAAGIAALMMTMSRKERETHDGDAFISVAAGNLPRTGKRRGMKLASNLSDRPMYADAESRFDKLLDR